MDISLHWTRWTGGVHPLKRPGCRLAVLARLETFFRHISERFMSVAGGSRVEEPYRAFRGAADPVRVVNAG